MRVPYPPRPRAETPEELGFKPARMFQWLSPPGLATCAYQVLIAGLVGRYLDKREMQRALPDPGVCDYSANEDGFWIDYVADTGDGFEPTYAIAYLLAMERLEVSDGDAGHATERGRVLVMGGDQVYPVPSEERYWDRLRGPYRAALPYSHPPDNPTLFAIPGNHDWYDGLTTFLRVFGQKRWLGGWRTQQSRSYFALKLPHGWWLWGIDTQLESFIDAPQLEYFTRVAEREAQPGDRVVLCTAKPTWIQSGMRGDVSYQQGQKYGENLEYFEQSVIRDKGLRPVLVLSGDLHHYARYETSDGSVNRITAGGGGAYLYPTHHLDKTIRWRDERDRPLVYERRAVYPKKSVSWWRSFPAMFAPLRTRTFVMMSAAVYALLTWSVRLGLRPVRGSREAITKAGFDDLVLAPRYSASAFVVALVLLGALFAFADEKGLKRLGLGMAHFAAHGVIGFEVMKAIDRWGPSGGWQFETLFYGLTPVTGGILGSLVVGLYLVSTHIAFGRHPNETFAAQGIIDYKCFLRLRIDQSGVLTVYPIGLRRVPRRREWTLRTEGRPEDPWFSPDRPLEPELIEKPFVCPRV